MSIVQSQEYIDIVDDIKRLRVEISMVLLEKDDLLLHQCKNIEANYLLKFGALEYDVYEAECLYYRMRRKLELIIAKRNRQEEINLEALERILDIEFENYKRSLSEMAAQMSWAAERSQYETLSAADVASLKSLYRKAVKALHPDLHPNLDENSLNLFVKATEAYETGNLDALRMICDMIGSEAELEISSSIEELEAERARLKESLKKIQSEIETIKNKYPYKLSKLLDDEAACEAKKSELEEALYSYGKQIAEYENRIMSFIEEYNNR